MSNITWHGVSSETLGVYVEKSPIIPVPRKKYIRQSIPGRNGDLVIDTGAYENVEQEYEIYMTESSNATVAAKAVKEWLLVQGEQSLIDSFDPDVYRYAFFEGGEEIENILQKFGRAKLVFNCRPQRYVLSSMSFTTYTAEFTLTNPSQNTALPIITLAGSGSGVLTVGNQTINLSDSQITLDSEDQNAYYGTTNKNNTMEGSFPELPAGETTISFSGGITSVSIAPRWFYL